MTSNWDMPRSAANDTAGTSPTQPRRTSTWSNGLFDPMAVLSWLIAQGAKIAVLTLVLAALGVGAVMMIPFPYRATAIVIADPRDQRITLQEEVLPSIGTDAAVLESMVQIVRSDGFLRDVMTELDPFGTGGQPLNAEEQSKQLAKFRKNLAVERKGATYLVEISYRAESGEEAARIANGVADAFADSQNLSRSSATQNAARSLSTQLVEVRARLNASEEAVARFKADNGIVYVDERNTVQMRQLAELNQQLALVRSATEEARARYDEHVNGGSVTRATTDGEGSQLSYLRQQRAQLVQSRDQQAQVYGPLHPRLTQANQAIAGIERQIEQERQNLSRELKTQLDVAVAKQAQIERQIGELSTNVSLTDAASVELDALEREAQANREIYQQLLSRNRATDQLALLTSENVRVVSQAIAPLNSTRPSMMLMAPVIGFLSFVVATMVVVMINGGTMLRSRRVVVAARPEERENDFDEPMAENVRHAPNPVQERQAIPRQRPTGSLLAMPEAQGVPKAPVQPAGSLLDMANSGNQRRRAGGR